MFTFNDHIFPILCIVLPLRFPSIVLHLSCFEPETMMSESLLQTYHTITILRITAAAFFISFYSPCPIILMSKADLQLWEASILRAILTIYLQPHITSSCNREPLHLFSHSIRVHHVVWEAHMVTDKAESSRVYHQVRSTVAFHLLTYSDLPHFPISTPLYFPLTLATLSRQWVVGIHFHLVVVLESPFSKQHDIIKTSA